MYLTFEEYKKLRGLMMEEEDFDEYVDKACEVVDQLTNFYYVFNDINSDIPFRREKFKEAIARQIEYFYDMEAKNAHLLQQEPDVQIGRTNIRNSEGRSRSKSSEESVLVSQDVYIYLDGTGLLYKGVCSI